jgi:hypothetical protein
VMDRWVVTVEFFFLCDGQMGCYSRIFPMLWRDGLLLTVEFLLCERQMGC